MKLTLMKNGSADLRCAVEIVERRLLDVFVEEGNADDALVRRVDVLAVDLEVLFRRLAGFARQRALGHPLEHLAQLRIHVGEPGRVGVGVGVEMIEADILHLVVALRVGQRVVGLTEVPLAREEGLVAAGLQHRGKRPLGRRQARRPAPGRPRSSCRCGSGCVRSASRHDPACSSVGRRTTRNCMPSAAIRSRLGVLDFRSYAAAAAQASS